MRNNFQAQATAAEIMCLAAILLPEEDVAVCVSIHDVFSTGPRCRMVTHANYRP
jgi:hypothetical protein